MVSWEAVGGLGSSADLVVLVGLGWSWLVHSSICRQLWVKQVVLWIWILAGLPHVLVVDGQLVGLGWSWLGWLRQPGFSFMCLSFSLADLLG